MIKVLITGANSYIGMSVEKWLNENPDNFKVDTIDMVNPNWKEFDFSKYDCIYHVAGIVHDIGNKKDADLYYRVNRDLVLETAAKAKQSGVKQFIYMSSMALYNAYQNKIITANTQLKVKGYYADSKLQADLALQQMNDKNFKVAVIRPPIIFGPGCKGNFPRLVKLASKVKIFPDFNNKRSMLYIDNLCEFIRLLIISGNNGIYFPQNEDYFSTTDIVKELSTIEKNKIWFTKLGNWLIYILRPMSRTFGKVFGNLVYDKELSNAFNRKYIVVGNIESIKNSKKEII